VYKNTPPAPLKRGARSANNYKSVFENVLKIIIIPKFARRSSPLEIEDSTIPKLNNS
jgi:hypothetical protein